MQCGVSVTWHVTSRLYRLLVGGLGTGLVACLYHAPAVTLVVTCDRSMS